MKRMKKLIAVGLALTLMLTAAGCGSGSGGASAGAAQEGGKKDTLVIAQGADPVSLDPYMTTDMPAMRVMNVIYDTLVTRGDDGSIQPALAESWDIVDDTTYVFHLRQGVKFHNGEEFKASDVAFSFAQIAESPHASSIRATIDFENSKVIDDYTFEMKLSEPFAPILNHLAHGVMSIVNEKAYTEANGDFSSNPCGTGPYKFVSRAIGDRVDLTANEEYWGGAPAIKNVVWRNIPEVASRSIEVEAGTSDVAIDIQATELDRLEALDGVSIYRNEVSTIYFICFNCQTAPFDNVKVRQAINMAINVQAIYDVVYQGTGKIARAPMSSVVWAFNDELPEHEYNPEKAKELLAEAGYPDGLDITITTDQNQNRLDTAEMVQAQLSQIGCNVTIETMERGAFIEKVIDGSLEMFGLGWSSDTGDPDYSLFASFHSSMMGEGGNMSFYSNPEVDRLLEEGRTNVVPEEREKAYKEAQAIVWDEVPCVFLQCPENLYAYNSNIEGFEENANGFLKIAKFSFK